MKRLGLIAILMMIVCSAANAECVINADAAFWTDANRFMAIGKVIVIEGADSNRASRMMMRDIKEGIAVILSKGTKVNLIDRPNEWVVVIDVGATPLCGLSQFVSCR
jgi:hypothetical protein